MLNRRQFLQNLGIAVVGGAVLTVVPGSAYSHETVFVVDVSGSMPVDQIQKIILEASKHNGLLITFDLQILDVMKLSDLTPDTQLRQGGGTNINCVDDYFSEHNLNPRNTVVFTDGGFCDGWGNLPLNTKWVITSSFWGEDMPVAPYGTTTFMEG